ncbi:putative phosphoesterase, alkaline-phosphatase-like, core domain superfamily [Helianthus annuus]|nr:putative phosphoesterase, alkaline-phosphatase-like, core domain superfamily [Helianthus annuus]KAJ0544293.1 putative phosphoesterase, alkaline-phosphatase-like, core domain superfamily [Helianthus annuus]
MCYAVISSPKGPAPNSEYEHSSIPATIKKMFNLSSNFLTHRDAWAGTFEHIVSQLNAPRTDCPGKFH